MANKKVYEIKKKNTSKKTETKKVTKKENIEIESENKVQDESMESSRVTQKGNKSGTVTILVLAAIIIFLIALFLPGNKNNKNEEKNLELTALSCEKEADDISNEDSKLNKVSCNGYQSLVEEENDNLILVARPTCGYCVKYVPILEEIVDEYDITINYFDIDTLSSGENSQFYSSSSLFTSNDFGTPTLMITNNNKIKEYSIGYKEKDATIKWLKDNGIIAG